MTLPRRRFLQLAAAAPLALSAARAWSQSTPNSPPSPTRTLVLIELRGGNDGLNTLIPYADPLYPKLRPTLAVPPRDVLHLDAQVGLHPALKPLMYAWDAQELAILQGVGFSPSPTRHDDARALWDTATPGASALTPGWVAQALKNVPEDLLLVCGATLDGPAPGPFAGGRAASLVEPRRHERAKQRAASPTSSALARLLDAHKADRERADILQAWLAKSPEPKERYPAGPFGRQLSLAARLLLSKAPLGALKLSLDGFDTHSKQADAHPKLLHLLAEGLATLRSELLRADAWNDALIVVGSEFGRSPKENPTRGTDHGTCAPYLILGAQAKGGLHGQPPALSDLTLDAQLKPTTDPRVLCATLARQWWGLPASGLPNDENLPTLALIK